MPRLLKPGNQVNGYTIVDHLNTGAMATSFKARNSEGLSVFFKSYKSPSCAVSWYSGYISYQKKLKQRLEGHLVGKFCVRQLDQFESKVGIPTFFQVFEFVHSGEDLDSILTRLRKNPTALNWSQRHILAKVLIAAIDQLHEAKIVHGDLKPPNLQLFPDKSIEAGYQLKLIDMDFSILADETAPWHGHSAYVGSPGYYSPEHLQGGDAIPGPASDVFTCGIILYELLAQGHPYSFESQEKYLEAIRKYTAKKPELIGTIEGDEAKTQSFSETLYRCLKPRSSDRPSAKELHLALNGLSAGKPATGSVTTPPGTQTLRMSNSTGRAIELKVSTLIGKSLLKPFGEEAKYAEEHQYSIEKIDQIWWIVPPPCRTKNMTLLNGKELTVATRLNSGDQIRIGSRESTGKTVLPISITLL